ncbi:MAG: acyl carrier protein, partial [Rhizobiales bacterium]|nr:acyl carrier protein [Hyphomicrobiales bacterium]
MSQSVEKDVREFILENFLFGDEDRMPEMVESLLEADLIDSTGILELVAYLEQHFGL